jgi:hypothetical protein
MRLKAILGLGFAAFLAVSCQTANRSSLPPERSSDRERQDRFIETGYDWAPSAGDRNDYEAYIKARGEPREIARKAIVNPQDRVKDEMLTLGYERYEMRYYVYSKRELWHPPKSLLMAVLSKEGGSYLFGIRLGMEEGNILGILGLAESGKRSVEFENRSGHRVELTFDAGKLSGILWDYSGE